MTVPDLYPELDEQLAEIGDPEAAKASGLFTIDSLDKANWAVRKVAQHRAKLADVERTAQRERDRLDLWLEGERERCESACGFLEFLLHRFHDSRLTDDPDARTIRLPAGELWVRKSRDRVEVDLKVFLASQDDSSPLVRTKREPDKPALLRHVKQTGEVPPGVQVIEGDDRFYVKTPEDR